uniref:Orf 00981 protein n=1 Tax=Saccharomyces cerevisiae TaxID=4932 RepID=E9PA66_YEASX|nr:orf 00981 [Saccharomyces cerevisiae]
MSIVPLILWLGSLFVTFCSNSNLFNDSSNLRSCFMKLSKHSLDTTTLEVELGLISSSEPAFGDTGSSCASSLHKLSFSSEGVRSKKLSKDVEIVKLYFLSVPSPI